MPRVKKNSDDKPVKKPVKKSSSTKTAKPAAKHVKPIAKPVAKTITKAPKKKARPVIIDVIEDDEAETFFPDFPELKRGTEVEDMAIDESDDDAENKKTELNRDKEENFSEEEEELYPAEELDQQKRFFSKLISERTEKNEEAELDEEEGGRPTRKSIGLYRRLVWRFVGLTAILVLIVLYFSFSKLTINISPNGEALNDSLLFKVQSDEVINNSASSSTSLTASSTNEDASSTDFRDTVDGTVKEIEINEEQAFPASGEEATGDEISGKVTLINNSAKSQALVASTRLLSADNKLFRIKNAVNIPAGGEVEAEIYADKPSEDLAIEPTSFTIPGLWLGLQDKIFAKSTTSFAYQQKVKKYIKASDIDNAKKEMDDILLTKVKQGQSEDINTGVIYEDLTPATIETNAKAGDSVEQFTVKAKKKMVIITYPKKQVAKLAQDKLALLVPDDKELIGYDAKNISYTFDNYDSKTGIASVKASFSGTMVLKNGTEILDKKQLVNLSKNQLENYLKTFPEIKSFELKFFPSFITHTPRLPERIEVDIK